MTNMTSPRARRAAHDFQWWVCSEYQVRAKKLFTVKKGAYRIYRPSDVEDLPGEFMSVLEGNDALMRFASSFVLLGYSNDLKLTPKDWFDLSYDRDDFCDRLEG